MCATMRRGFRTGWPVTASGGQEVTTRNMSYDPQGLPYRVHWAEFASYDDYETISPRASGTYYYRYDGSGQRIWQQGTGPARRTVRGPGGAALAVVDGSGSLVYWNVSGGHGRVEPSGRRLFYVRDLVGTVRAVVEGASGSVVEARDHYVSKEGYRSSRTRRVDTPPLRAASIRARLR